MSKEIIGYAVEQRLRLIDFLLHYYGSVGRNEIVDFFGIAEATATRDFALYKTLSNGNAIINQNTKRWVRAENFKRLYA